MDSLTGLLFQLIVLIFSVMVHEVSHGFVAEWLGDPTARRMGRLNLNPLNHIDPFGSVILPAMLVFTHAPVLLGWAKPVPYDPRFLKNPRDGAAKIAAAGPLSNFLIAAIFGAIGAFVPLEHSIKQAIILHPGSFDFLSQLPSPSFQLASFFFFLISVIYTNISLAVFNLVPIPPLDGSRVLWNYLPHTEAVRSAELFFERYGFWILFAFIFFGFSLISPIIATLYLLFAGG